MQTTFKHPKLELSKVELKTLLERLIEGGYGKTAQEVFRLIAHTGVEVDTDPELKEKPSLEEFLNAN
jgi:hypothetical protein